MNAHDNALHPTPSSSALSPSRMEALLAHSDWLNRLARQLVGDPNEADEVVQEAWVKAIERPPVHEGNLKGWLARVVRRSISRRQRSAMRRIDHEAQRGPREDAVSAADLAGEVALQRDLQTAVLELPDVYRDTLILRFFEDLPPRKIAARTGAPVATVQSRIHRGTQMLRAHFDQVHGEGRDWRLALVPLAAKAAVGEAVATAVGLGVAGTIGATVIVGGALVIVRAPLDQEREEPAAVSIAQAPVTEIQEGDVVTPKGDTGKRVDLGKGDGTPKSDKEGAAAPDFSVRGTVLELDGIPAPHVRMRRQSKNVVRWQTGDRGWISGPGGSRQISAEDELRLNEDKDFARRMLKGVPHRDEWRATLLGAPLPGRDQSANPDGTFAFDTGELLAASTIEVADKDWIQLARGTRTTETIPTDEDGEPISGAGPVKERDRVWIAARSHRIEGVVRGAGGEPIARGRARVLFDAKAALRRLPFDFDPSSTWSPPSMNISKGLFLIRSAPAGAGALLEVSAPGHRTTRLPIPRSLPDPFIVELRSSDASLSWKITGVVKDVDGSPVPRALVALGGNRTRADQRGAFELAAEKVSVTDDLVAVCPEADSNVRGAYYERSFGGTLIDGSRGDRLELELTQALGSIAGRVESSSGGAPWHIEVDDPTLLEFSFLSVEKRAAARAGDVVVGSDGTFVLKGLFDRAYDLRVWRPRTGEVHIERGVRPGDQVVIEPDKSQRAVTGTVVGGAGAKVSVMHRTFGTPSGDGGLYDGGPDVVCDAGGGFRMQRVPQEGAFLNVVERSGASYLVPVELLGSAPVELSMPDTAILELRAEYLSGDHSLYVENASGSILPVCELTAGTKGAMQPKSIASNSGRFRAVLIPLSADAVIVVDPLGVHSVLPIEPVRGKHVPVRLR